MAKKPFPKGTLVRYTTRFLRQIGSVTGPIDGLVLGTGPIGNLVAWSDGTTMIVNPYNLQRTKKQLSEAEKKALVTAERDRLHLTMEGYTREEVEEIAEHYNGREDNPRKPRRKAKKKAAKRSPRKKGKKTTRRTVKSTTTTTTTVSNPERARLKRRCMR